MPARNHPCFLSPENRDIKIWRYMDFAKFMFLLDSKSLFFSRSDLFEDPYEGATSHINVEFRPRIYKPQGVTPEMLKQEAEYMEWSRQWTFINCWHMNEYESEAMWKLYSKSNESVAIQSTFNLLFEALSDEVLLGIVNYIDYDNDFMPENNYFWNYLHKRKSYEHEKELRAIIRPFKINGESIPKGTPNTEYGKTVKVQISEFIQKIYISPRAQPWFADLVKNVISIYDLEVEVVHSILSKKPEY